VEIIETDDAPEPGGAYSQAVIDDGRVYVSGQVGVDPETGEVVSGGVAAQTEQVMANLEAVLAAADASLDDAIKANVYLTDIDAFEEVNEAYADALTEPYPARAAVEVADLVSPFEVEIELVASLD